MPSDVWRCRLLTGNTETSLSVSKFAGACTPIPAAVTDGEFIQVGGIFGGTHVFSGSFEFQPDVGNLIHGALDPELSEEAATALNRDFTRKRAIAKMKMTMATIRAGRKQPGYELNARLTIKEHAHKRGHKPPSGAQTCQSAAHRWQRHTARRQAPR